MSGLLLSITSVEGYDPDTSRLIFTVSRADQSVSITLNEQIHDATTWRQCADGVAKAVDMLMADNPQPVEAA